MTTVRRSNKQNALVSRMLEELKAKREEKFTGSVVIRIGIRDGGLASASIMTEEIDIFRSQRTRK